MFTWICPQCGREVPPSYSECPTCAENRAKGMAPGAQAPAPGAPQGQPQYAPPAQPQYAPPAQPQYAAPAQPQYAAPAQPEYAAPAQPQYAPPPQAPGYAPQPVSAPVPPPPAYAQPPQPQYTPPAPQYAPPPPPPQAPAAWQSPPQQNSQPYYVVGDTPKKKVPAWLVMVGTAAVLGLGLFGLYRFVGGGTSTEESAPSAAASKEAAPSGTHPYAKFMEITGLRLSEENNKVKVQYLVVNHSAAAFSGLELKVTLTTINAKPEDPPLAVFDSKVGDVEPFGSKDMSELITTKLRAYELPDWQFLKATFSITAPQ
jgi:hypothetical protein